MNDVIYMIELYDILGTRMVLTTDCYECANGIFENAKNTDEIDLMFFTKDENGTNVELKRYDSSLDDDVDISSLIGKE